MNTFNNINNMDNNISTTIKNESTMNTHADFFEGFAYANVLKYVNKLAHSYQGMLTDRSLEFDDLVSVGLIAATNAFRKWDLQNNNDRTDVDHLEAFVKTNISGYLKNMFMAAKRRNQLIEDEVEDDDDEDSDTDDDITTSEEDSCIIMIENDEDAINGKTQRKYAKVFHAGNDEESVAMMDIASSKISEESDERLGALEAFINTLSGIELDIMNNILNRSDDSIKKIASRYHISTGCVSRKCIAVQNAAREFITNY